MSYLSFLGKRVSTYGLLGLLGFVFGIIYLFTVVHKKSQKEISFEDCLYVYVWSVVFAIIGAKKLYLLLNVREIVGSIIDRGFSFSTIYPYISGGFVFYGGLIGAILGCFAACAYFKLERNIVVSLMLPTFPLMHAFGRIGCSAVGCCYGIETTSRFYLMYHNSVYAPNEVHLVPTQIYEAIFELAIFIVLVILFYRSTSGNHMLFLYLISYSTFRFIIEFWRGDEARGHLGVLSTSQIISIVIIVISICTIVNSYKGKRRKGV
ncbi:MAG: prolipoprotein diacylglyceryl transferase [Lachnospiraceae bacterium]|nr:prolipoprotein diacylglyceryl transferase [Lachnospiraceae bacterium]